ncbi:MAG TPA: hypothetical protein VJO15_06535, partial [Dehalococcoidia bacterium]|nr:hypothetical protein [Dehalococcoidia bacterium]
VRLLQGHGQAAEIWSGVMEGEHATVSCLTIIELARLARKGAISQRLKILSARGSAPFAISPG